MDWISKTWISKTWTDMVLFPTLVSVHERRKKHHVSPCFTNPCFTNPVHVLLIQSSPCFTTCHFIQRSAFPQVFFFFTFLDLFLIYCKVLIALRLCTNLTKATLTNIRREIKRTMQLRHTYVCLSCRCTSRVGTRACYVQKMYKNNLMSFHSSAFVYFTHF